MDKKSYILSPMPRTENFDSNSKKWHKSKFKFRLLVACPNRKCEKLSRNVYLIKRSTP